MQRSILDDDALINDVEELIRQNLGAEKAFEITMFEWSQKFSRAAHPMLREKVGDLKDVEIRVLTLLLDLPDHDPVDLPKGAKAILVTHDLTPSLTVQLDRDAIVAIATDAGTRTSHVAILARSLGLPAIVGLRTATQELSGGETAILDGSTGLLAINPTADEVAAYKERARQEAVAEEELRQLATLEAVTTERVITSVIGSSTCPACDRCRTRSDLLTTPLAVSSAPQTTMSPRLGLASASAAARTVLSSSRDLKRARSCSLRSRTNILASLRLRATGRGRKPRKASRRSGWCSTTIPIPIRPAW